MCGLMQARLVLNAILYPCMVAHGMGKGWWHTSSDFFSARKRHQQLSFTFLLPCGCTGPPVLPVVCSPSWMFETGELDTVSYCAGQGEGAIDREQKEKLNPPWRQGKSLPGIQSTTKLFWSNFGHADRPRQLFRDYKLWACSCLQTT